MAKKIKPLSRTRSYRYKHVRTCNCQTSYHQQVNVVFSSITTWSCPLSPCCITSQQLTDQLVWPRLCWTPMQPWINPHKVWIGNCGMCLRTGPIPEMCVHCCDYTSYYQVYSIRHKGLIKPKVDTVKHAPARCICKGYISCGMDLLFALMAIHHKIDHTMAFKETMRIKKP